MASLEELLAPGNFSSLQKYLGELNAVDLANELNQMEQTKVTMVLRLMPKDQAAEVFTYLDSNLHRQIVEAISMKEVQELIDQMFVDDAVDFLEELPDNMVYAILNNADPATRNLINRFLKYPDNSAGSIMTVEYVVLFETMTCQAALESIREAAIDKETIYTCYVTDDSRKLIGVVSLKDILLADDSVKISELMITHVVSVNTHEDQEVVAKIFQKYDLIALPVTDKDNRIVGIITVDDVVDVIEEENTEDLEKMTALRPSEYEYLQASPWRLALNRLPWLLIMMFSASFSEGIIRYFNLHFPGSEVITMAALTAFIPMLMNTGGNCGSQASTLIIRGMAVGDIRLTDYWRILGRESGIALLIGSTLAVVNLGRVICVSFLKGDGFICPDMVDYLVSFSMILVIFAAKIIGCSLPMLARACKIDPALMASPMVATIVDVVTLMIFFSVAATACGFGI